MTEQRAHRAQAVQEPPLLGRMGPGPRPIGTVERAKDTRGTVRRLWGYLRRQKGALIVTAALVVVTTILTVLGPYLLGHAIDAYVLPGDLPGVHRAREQDH